jgi:hypothetical protein
MDPKVSVDNIEKLNFLTVPELELWPLGHLACTQLLYRLCYCGSTCLIVTWVKWHLGGIVMGKRSEH